jgi:tetratricopeptide (TPR) repeat protein
MPTPLLSNFTPSLMSPETLERIFVQREGIAQDLVDRIILSVTTPAKHHSLLIGARGMGKTHLVSLVYYRLQQHKELDDKLIVAWLREDEWGIDSWLDLVVRIFRALGEATVDTKELLAQLQQVSIADAEILATQLLTELIGDKTLLLIIENLDELFAGLGESGQKKFRSFLQERQCCNILATTPALFAGVQDRSEPFFGFFNPIPLSPLNWEEATVMLQKIAELDGQADLANFLQTPAGKARVRAVHHLAGGNPRVYTLFAQFITRESLDELVQAFMKMLDDLTPYYQSRMKELSNQQRKIVEFLVDRREAVMVKEIATQCFIEQRVVSGQLLQLRNKGYVVARANGRESFYELTEVLMRLCMEVKKYRGQWVELFVDFLRIWYRPAERQGKLAMLRGNGGLVSDEHLELALMSDADPVLVVVSREFQNCLEQKNRDLALQILAELHAIGGISEAKYQQISELINTGEFEEVKSILEQAVGSDSNNVKELFLKGLMLLSSEKWSEALVALDRVLAIDINHTEAWHNRGILLRRQGRHDEAIASYDRAIEFQPDNHRIWYNRGISLYELGRSKESISSYERATKLKFTKDEALHSRGILLRRQEKYEEAVASYDRAIKFNPKNHEVWYNRGICLYELGRYEESIFSYDRAIEFKSDNYGIWHNKGFTFFRMGKYQESIDSYDKAISIKPDEYDSWHDKGFILFSMGNYSAAITIWKQTFNIIHRSTDRQHDVAGLIQEFIEILIPKFTQPAVKTMLIELVQTYIQTSVLTELGTALVRTLKQILTPDISDYTAQQWLALWQELLGDRPEMQLPFRLMTTAILYKQHPERKERLWLGLASEERSILDEALE